VDVYALPVIGFTNTVTKKTVQFNASDTLYKTYSWSFGDSVISHAEKPVHIYSKNGHYLVKLTVVDSNGCDNTTTDSVIINTVGVDHFTEPDFNLNIFPNPFENTFRLSYFLPQSHKVRISIQDITGKEISLIKAENQVEGAYQFDINTDAYSMHPGIYLLKLTIDDALVNRKIIRLK
jgi:PKD repeat protein